VNTLTRRRAQRVATLCGWLALCFAAWAAAFALAAGIWWMARGVLP
jgi:hypothetical protein